MVCMTTAPTTFSPQMAEIIAEEEAWCAENPGREYWGNDHRYSSKWHAKRDESHDAKFARTKAARKAAEGVDIQVPIIACAAATDKQVAFLKALIAEIYPGRDLAEHTAKVIAEGKPRVSQAITTLIAKRDQARAAERF